MSSLQLTFTSQVISPIEDPSAFFEAHEIADNVDAIVDITRCGMQWADPTANTVGWVFFFRNENQEECVRSMVEDLIRSYPHCLSLTVN